MKLPRAAWIVALVGLGGCSEADERPTPNMGGEGALVESESWDELEPLVKVVSGFQWVKIQDFGPISGDITERLWEIANKKPAVGEADYTYSALRTLALLGGTVDLKRMLEEMPHFAGAQDQWKHYYFSVAVGMMVERGLDSSLQAQIYLEQCSQPAYQSTNGQVSMAKAAELAKHCTFGLALTRSSRSLGKLEALVTQDLSDILSKNQIARFRVGVQANIYFLQRLVLDGGTIAEVMGRNGKSDPRGRQEAIDLGKAMQKLGVTAKELLAD